MNFKQVAKKLLKDTQFEPVHMGGYIRHSYFWREVAKLPVERFQKVLDAGCGSGQYAIEFARRFPHIEVHGVDLRLPQPHQLLPPNCRLRQGDLLNLQESQQYDFIWCIDVLEHIPDNERALISLIAALCYGGFLYLHVPYDNPRKKIFPESWFVGFNEWAEKEHIGEQRPLDEWTAILREAGLKITSAEWTFGFWGELAWEIDRLTDGKPIMKVMSAPILKAIAHVALSQSGSKRRGNVLLVGHKYRQSERGVRNSV
jgi:SAM-dependent methyltransferase